ncbi:MAG TPA: NYN domain-containing protein [Burkholderiaceae bacterium]
MRNPVEDALLSKPTRRMMVFVDGENLVFRYQETLKRGRKPREDLVHEPDVFVWAASFTTLAQQHEILRTTYYTYVVGDDVRLASIKTALQAQRFDKHMASLLPSSLSPVVFKKDSKGRSGKGVDIQLSVDVLSHVYRGNVDSILLLTGDGDFAPLIDEVRRAGVLVYVSAFADGFNPTLRERADASYELDGTTWV